MNKKVLKEIIIGLAAAAAFLFIVLGLETAASYVAQYRQASGLTAAVSGSTQDSASGSTQSSASGSTSGNSAGSTQDSSTGNSDASDAETVTRSEAELREDFETTLDAVLAYIDYYYYDDEVDYEQLYEDMLHAAVESLGDPYSTYYTAEEMEELWEQTSGVYSGIGATISQSYDTMDMTIVTPFAGSPADEAGILPEDQIVAVNGESVLGWYLSDVVAIIKGEAGTDVVITMLRDGELIDFTVTRRSITVEYVTYRMIDDEVGYILVSEFEEKTGEQFNAAITSLQKQGMKGLIVDLRGNPGGLYDVVCDMLDRILPKNSLLVYTIDKYNNKKCEYAESRLTLDIPIAVLINGNSASASEIFAGALQDHGAATIVGTQSFGKGIVQSIMYITEKYDGIKLTTSRYFTPAGVCIHDIGITPDVVVELEAGLEKQLIERRDHDNQIDAAVEVIHEQLDAE